MTRLEMIEWLDELRQKHEYERHLRIIEEDPLGIAESNGAISVLDYLLGSLGVEELDAATAAPA